MSLWLYVIIGLIVIVVIFILMKADSRPIRSLKQNNQLITNVDYICLHCGNKFNGATCPNCGFNSKRAEFGNR